MDGWVTWHRQTEDGAVESEQRVALSKPVVEFSSAGGVQLGSTYWREVRRATRSVVRPRQTNGSLELRLLGWGPTLLRFGPPTVEATQTLVSCAYPIEGGLLARQASGKISFEQTGGVAPTVSSTIRGFFPRLAARRGGPTWTGALYNQLQSRAHVAISRRYFKRLIAEAGE
jgi:hypothetical protein